MAQVPAGLQPRLLQASVAIACLVPIIGGGLGVALGPGLIQASSSPALDSHFRYLSGLLLGIGIAYASSIPGITRHRPRFRFLCGLVVIGGIGRLLSVFAVGGAGWATYAALAMELLVTPALTLWQHRASEL